jgi:hypothetical protein
MKWSVAILKQYILNMNNFCNKISSCYAKHYTTTKCGSSQWKLDILPYQMDIASTLLEFGADANAESKVLSYSKTMLCP